MTHISSPLWGRRQVEGERSLPPPEEGTQTLAVIGIIAFMGKAELPTLVSWR
jgi:hypothetical protein